MPMWARRCGAMRRRSTPSSIIVPARVGSAPMIARISVVLPAPLRPMTPHSDPAGTSSDTARRTGVAPMLTSTRLISSTPDPTRHVRPNARIRQDVAGCAISENAPFVEGEDARAVAFDDVDVVLDEHHRGLPLFERGHDDVHDGELLLAADAAGRLVEKEQRRLPDGRHGDVHQLPDALWHDGGGSVTVGVDPI